MRIYHEQVEWGCFVFQVVRTDSHIQQAPVLEDEEEEHEHEEENDDEDDQFEDGELLAVDMIQPGDTAVFVRLADQSGWVAAEIRGETFLRRVPVDTNILIPMVADVPQMVRRHPMDDSSELLSSELQKEDDSSCIWHLQPMQTVYCDAMVEHPDTGIRFFRIQGAGSESAPATPGWIHDQTQEHECRLLPAHKILRNNHFAFVAVCDTVVRERPDCTTTSKTAIKIKAGEIVVADLMRESPAVSYGNGPFVRLVDGSGWLFCKKLHRVVLNQIPVLSGHWIFTVLNDPTGIHQYEQPGRVDMPTGVTYPFGGVIECDMCIESTVHGNFYHVIGSQGWICEKEDGRRCLSLLQALEVKRETITSWSVDFVRGVVVAAAAATASSSTTLVETMYDENSGIVTLKRSDDLHYKIFCQSRTVAVFYRTEPSEPLRKQFHSPCTAEGLVQILSRTVTDTALFYQQQQQQAALPTAKSSEESESSVDTFKSFRAAEQEEKKDDRVDLQQQHQHQQRSLLLLPTHVTGVALETQHGRKMAEEDELRRQLLQLDAQLLELHKARCKLIGSLKPFDTERDTEALFMKDKLERRQQSNRQKYLQQQQQEQLLLTPSPTKSKRTTSSRTKKVSGSESSSRDNSKASSSLKSLKSPSTVSISPKPSIGNVSAMSKRDGSTIRSSAQASPSPSPKRIPKQSIRQSSQRPSPRPQPAAPVTPIITELDEAVVEDNDKKEEELLQETSFRQSPSRNLVSCRECNKEFSGKYSRDLHCRNVHKLFCEHCDRIFYSFKELDLHIATENHW